MSADIIGMMTLSLTLVVHLLTSVWWAASLTRRVDHIEKWIAHNENTAERLAAMDAQMRALSAGIGRIEHCLRHKA